MLNSGKGTWASAFDTKNVKVKKKNLSIVVQEKTNIDNVVNDTEALDG